VSALLACERVRVVREGKTLLHELTFELNAGEVLVMLGLNGAGKSTLLNALANETPIANGVIRIDGTPLDRFDPHKLAAVRALNAVEPPLAFSLSVFDYAALGRPFDAANEDEILRALDECHATQWRDRDAASLSSGELLRVQLARSLYQLGNAKNCVWLLDEPMAHLDLAQRQFALQLLRRVATERAWAVVFSTHEPCDALAIADRVLLLREGQSVANGVTSSVMTRSNMQACYGSETILDAFHLN
jgi:iron complex transport system ATP-binding protein